MADTLQGLRQASFRAIGGTEGSYNEDAYAAFAAEATIPPGASWNEACLLWLNTRLGASYTNLPDAMQAFAADQGVERWDAIGTFGAAAGSADFSASDFSASDFAT